MALQKFYLNNVVEAGTDEAGRGCLAGPVYAAAVILPLDFHDERVRDSKRLSPKRREELRKIILSLNKTVLLTTHYLEEAKILSDRIIILDKGKVSKIIKDPNFL